MLGIEQSYEYFTKGFLVSFVLEIASYSKKQNKIEVTFNKLFHENLHKYVSSS